MTIIRNDATPAGQLIVEYLGGGFWTASIGGQEIVKSTVLADRKDGNGAGVEGRLNGKPVFIRVAAALIDANKDAMAATDAARDARLNEIARAAAPIHAARARHNAVSNEGGYGYNPYGN